MEVNIRISKRVFNDIYLPYLDNDDRYLVFYGGGSSGKSYFIAECQNVSVNSYSCIAVFLRIGKHFFMHSFLMYDACTYFS